MAPRPTPAHAVAALYQLMTSLAAFETRIGLRALGDTDFSRQRPRDRQWLRANRARQLAIYLTVTACDVPPSALAPVIGISKQAIGKTLARIEDSRDDAALARVVKRIEDRLGLT